MSENEYIRFKKLNEHKDLLFINCKTFNARCFSISGPTAAPTNVSGEFINHTSLYISWSRVPTKDRNGIILGYKLSYKDETLPTSDWINITIANDQGGTDLFNKTLSNLKIYTKYIVRVLGFTYRAEGPFSKNIIVRTDDYGT